MPELARFLGMVIGMFYREHGVAHIHAVYGEHEIEWMSLHTAELLENWQLAKQGQPLKRIAPLE